ncbi:hypothetical protein HYH03_010937 [Edaphochlamys debaryana]|uniref:SHSP domain-containing protein n=1 Tax=Edaphochlamys debaryana TaxID=47281 RepID=A0A836BWV5_9CHLO|nr:hypothetical protein HYH03_010937 [Edaphochlamys debaryana]|eukprot:KAG2490543.1 hypothetical protein HYH03_010937 [Edaphochlamys debaryana]
MSPKPPRSAGAAAQAPGVRLASDGSAGGRRRSWGSALSRLALTLVDPLGLFTRGRRDAAAADEDADVDMDEQLMPGGGGAGAGAGGVGEEDARQAGEWRGLAAGADAALAGAGGGGRGVGGGGEESELSSEEMAAAVGGGVAEGAGGGSSGYEEDDEAGMGEGEEGEGMLEEGGEEEEEDGFEHQEGDEEEEEAEDEEAVAQQEDAVLREEASTLRAARAAAPQPPRRRRPRPGHHAPLGGGVRVGGSRGGATKYPMDVFEDDCCYELQADVPGMCESDLVVAADAHHLTVEGTDLTVTSQASRPVQGAAAGVEGGARPPRAVRTERRRRRHFKRTFRLPHDADAAAISASLADGVLVVRLAKARGAAATSAATSAAAARPSDASAVGGGASALGRRRVRVDRLPSARVDPTVIAEATAAAAAMAEHPWPVGIQPPAAAEPAAAAGPTLPAAEAVAVSKLVAPESTAYGGGGVGVSYEAPGGTGGFSTGGDGSGSGGGEGGKEVVAEAGEMGPQSPPSSPPPRPGQAAAAAAKAPPPPATPRQVPLS